MTMPSVLVVISSSVLVGLSFWAAYFLDSFATMVLSLPGFLLFSALALNVIANAVKKRSMKELKPIAISCIGLACLFLSFKASDHGLTRLKEERERAMTALRPYILSYRQEKGNYPDKLELLVPEYISHVPGMLRVSEQEDPYKRIIYELEKGKPVFRYRVARGPDSSAKFDVETGEITQDM